MKRRARILLVVSILLAIGGLMYFSEFQKEPPRLEVLSPKIEKKPITVILSPHFDDAVLSLGGVLLMPEQKSIVATFFTAKPKEPLRTAWDLRSGFKDSTQAIEARTEENKKALGRYGAKIRNYDYLDFQYREKGQDRKIEDAITRDIESLLSSYGNRQIFMYGPGVFGQKITHPDHRILHDAFLAVVKKRDGFKRAQFFIYEDFPYIRQFVGSGMGDFRTYLSNADGVELEEIPIQLTEEELSEKINGISDYASQITAFGSFGGSDIAVLAEKFAKDRCKKTATSQFACEVVYRVLLK